MRLVDCHLFCLGDQKPKEAAAAKSYNEKGPSEGTCAKVTKGKHKGKFGTVVKKDGRSVVLSDSSGRKLTIPKDNFKV